MNQLGCGTEGSVLDVCVTGTVRNRSQNAGLVIHIKASQTYSICLVCKVQTWYGFAQVMIGPGSWWSNQWWCKFGTKICEFLTLQVWRSSIRLHLTSSWDEIQMNSGDEFSSYVKIVPTMGWTCPYIHARQSQWLSCDYDVVARIFYQQNNVSQKWVRNESWCASVSTIAQPWQNDDATQEKES